MVARPTRLAGRCGAAVALFVVLVVGCGGDGGDARGGEHLAPAARTAEVAVLRMTRPPAILIVDVTTGSVRQLRTSVRPAMFDRVSWSPDGHALAFAAAVSGERGEELTDVFVVGADGSGLRRLTSTGRATQPLWAPDGSKLVFSQRAPGDRFRSPATLWEVALEGAPRELTRSDGLTADVAGSFAPDGRRLAFTRVRDTSSNALPASVNILDLADRSVKQLADRAAFPAYSPDGSRIAYVTDVDENGSLSYGDAVRFAMELYVTDTDGSDPRRLTRTRELDELAPAWSQDGQVLAFVRGKQFDNAEGYAVMAMAADGTCVRPLVADPSLGAWYGSPAWRPGSPAVERCRPARGGTGIVRNDLRAELRRARAFRGFGLFWVGPRLAELYLADVFTDTTRGPGGRATTHTLVYRNCRLEREGSGCEGFQVQLWPACARVPADVDLPANGRVRVRGVHGVFFEGGNRLEIVTGKTTVVVFAPGRRAALRAVRALRGLNVRIGVREKLPRPAPGVLRRANRCR